MLVHIHADADAVRTEVCRDYFLELCRVWRTTATASIVSEGVADCIASCFDRGKSAKDIFKQLEEFVLDDAVYFGDLGSMIHPAFPVEIRLEALRLMHNIASHPKRLLLELESLVYFDDGAASAKETIDEVVRLKAECKQNAVIWSELCATGAPTQAQTLQVTRCLEGLIESLRKAVDLLNPLNGTFETYQGVFKKLEFENIVVSASDADGGLLNDAMGVLETLLHGQDRLASLLQGSFTSDPGSKRRGANDSGLILAAELIAVSFRFLERFLQLESGQSAGPGDAVCAGCAIQDVVRRHGKNDSQYYCCCSQRGSILCCALWWQPRDCAADFECRYTQNLQRY